MSNTKDLDKRLINKINTWISNGYEVTTEGKLLHREIYKKIYGRIPRDWVIHHVDGNKKNNNPNNLLALPSAVHNNIHRNSRKHKQCLPGKAQAIKQRDAFVLLEFNKYLKKYKREVALIENRITEYRKQSLKELETVDDCVIHEIKYDLYVKEESEKELNKEPTIIKPPRVILRKSGSSSYR